MFSVKETLTFTARIANLQQSYNCHGSAFQFDRFNSEASLVSRNKSKNSWQERVDRVIDLVGLSESRDVWVGGQVYTGLSTGQKRRLSIAEQLIKEPHILLLDEPLSGLDSTAATGIMNILQELARGIVAQVNLITDCLCVASILSAWSFSINLKTRFDFLLLFFTKYFCQKIGIIFPTPHEGGGTIYSNGFFCSDNFGRSIYSS